MMNFVLGELVQLAQAQLVVGSAFKDVPEQIRIATVSTSSREIGEHCLFVPLKGERFDGHTFVVDALSNGAVACVTHMSKAQLLDACPAERQDELRELLEKTVLVQCEDTLHAYGLCGQLIRRKCDAVVGAITGSCGKTSVKEMSAAILQECGKTLYTEANFNNDVGVPLTLLRLDQSYDFAIIEQGASHLQDIARTAKFVEADFALITNVGEAHILGFGSREGVYHGKSEILDKLFKMHPQVVDDLEDGVKNAGIGIVPADSEWFASWQRDYAEQFASGQLLSFGASDQATLQVSKIVVENGFLSFHLKSNDPRWQLDGDVKMEILGAHNAINAAAAALLALVMGASEIQVLNGLRNYRPLQGRLSLMKSASGNLTVIDDAYNASFNAVIAAIDTLQNQKGLKIFIFGDMGELGDAEIELHQKVGEHARGRVDLLLCVGPLAQFSAKAMQSQALHFTQHEALLNFLYSVIEQHHAAARAGQLDNGEVTCLVKGSHAMHMDRIVDALKDYIKKLDQTRN